MKLATFNVNGINARLAALTDWLKSSGVDAVALQETKTVDEQFPEKALAEALEEKRIFGAILDVFREEPLPKSSPLWSLPNVFITPHISGKSFNHSHVIERKIAEICAENINRFIEGKPPKNLIRKEIGYAENL